MTDNYYSISPFRESSFTDPSFINSIKPSPSGPLEVITVFEQTIDFKTQKEQEENDEDFLREEKKKALTRAGLGALRTDSRQKGLSNLSTPPKPLQPSSSSSSVASFSFPSQPTISVSPSKENGKEGKGEEDDKYESENFLQPWKNCFKASPRVVKSVSSRSDVAVALTRCFPCLFLQVL